MKISLNEIKKYVNIPAEISTEELVKLIGSRLVEVEGTEDWGAKYRGIYIVKVVECEAIPDTHLHLCQIDNGSEKIQVVCGAPNVHKDMLAVWIAPGSIVPATYGADDELQLDVRKLRGYESHGMLAGADELGLGDDHSGIVEIDPDFAQPGDDFADKFGLNDIILDIENKSLTHRPDCFGLIGFAREVAGILGIAFEEGQNRFAKNIPQPPSQNDNVSGRGAQSLSSRDESARKRCDSDHPLGRGRPQAYEAGVHPLGRVSEAKDRSAQSDSAPTIRISDPTICPRYSCAVMEFTDAPHSPYLTESDIFLYKADMRPVSPIVDITNIIMLQTGQPLHAFDYDKFVAVGGSDQPQITVRTATDGEQLTLLDGKTITCDENDILITSNNIPVALAGAMGGANTEIDSHTKRIILESATFSLYNLRKTQMKHGIFSEAITRFTKGQPASITLPVLQQAVAQLGVDHLVSYSDAYPAPQEEIVVKITADEVNKLLGSDYDTDVIVKTLGNVGFENVPTPGSSRLTRSEDREGARNDGPTDRCPDGDILKFKAPAWRTDIHIREDLIEEVGRLLGYDNIPLAYPLRPFTGATPDPLFALKSTLRGILSDKLNAHEVLTYSFVSENLQQRVGEDPANSYQIVNSISPELQCFRQSLTPSLLSKVRPNLKDGHKDFTLYEMNQISRKSDGLDGDGVPITRTRLAALTLGNYYDIKALSQALWRSLHVTLKYDAFDSAPDYPYFEPKHAATLYINDVKIGAFGEIRTSVLRQFKLESTPVSALELSLEALLPLLDAPERPLIAQSKFPAVHRDFTFAVATEANFGQIRDLLTGIFAENQLFATVTPVSIYQKSPDSPTKHLSFHLKFAHPDHTLSSEEISSIIDTVTNKAAELGAELI